MIRRMFISWLLLAVSVVGFTGLAGASATDESSMVSLINSERAAHGLGTLDVYWDLVDDARAWTGSMISDGYISHNPNLAGVTTGWSTLGENVGVGPNVDRLHTAFMDSPGHKANILGNYNYIGVGADRSPDGNLYITVVFMLGPAGLVNPPTTTTTAPPPPPTTTTTTAPAPTPTTTTTTTAPAPAPTTTTTTTTTTTVPSAAASPTTSTT
ncbi:MAG: CAP domain-containing protein, partial [Acidimicrobiia bacterium]|nr:CAP domain-containing protein [Acidimicrobiia bacterium]